MIFVDTNYFLRFLLNDINKQHLEAKELFLEASQGKIKLISSTIVFFEIYWVLSSYYNKKKQDIISALQAIIDLKFIGLKERQILQNSLSRFKKANFDLEDCYNIAYTKSRIVKEFRTFDDKLKKEFQKKS